MLNFSVIQVLTSIDMKPIQVHNSLCCLRHSGLNVMTSICRTADMVVWKF